MHFDPCKLNMSVNMNKAFHLWWNKELSAIVNLCKRLHCSRKLLLVWNTATNDTKLMQTCAKMAMKLSEIVHSGFCREKCGVNIRKKGFHTQKHMKERILSEIKVARKRTLTVFRCDLHFLRTGGFFIFRYE